jgi:hypothetical protein
MVMMTVTRDSGYADVVRAYSVLLDGKKIGEIRNGETKKFSIEPGAHTMSFKIDWCGSKTLDFTAVEDQPLAFRAESNLRGWRLLLAGWYAIVDRTSYLLIEQTA